MLYQERVGSKSERKAKIMRSQVKKKDTLKGTKLKRNSTVVLRGINRHGCEIFHKTELRKFLPNGSFPEAQGGWELRYLHFLASI